MPNITFTIRAIYGLMCFCEAKQILLGRFTINFYRDFLKKPVGADPINSLKQELLRLADEVQEGRVLSSEEIAWLQFYRSNMVRHINASLQKRRKRQDRMAKPVRCDRDILTWEGDPYAE